MVSSLSVDGWGWERESGRSEVTCHSLCAPRMLVILSALLCAASAEVQKLEPVGLLRLVLSKRTEQRKRSGHYDGRVRCHC